MPDVIIAGGGIAGCSAAILLARRGFTVELFERGQFPKEKACGEGLMPGGVAVLRRMGLAEAVAGEPFIGIRYHFGNQVVEGPFPTSCGNPVVGRAQRRLYLDQALFSAATNTPGVSVHTGAQVDRLLIENGRVVGLVVNEMPRRALLAVAADGHRSRIRRALGLDLPVKRKRLGACCHFRLARGKEQPSWVDVFIAKGHELYVTALPQRELLVAALVDAEGLREPVEQAFRRWCQEEPELASRLDGAEQISSLLCTSPLSGRARSGVAPGIVLLGDAAGFEDPITGGGMTQALMTAELLAKSVSRDLATSEQWLWDFDRRRRRLLRDYRRLTQAVLWLAKHPSLVEYSLSCLRLAPAILGYLIEVSASMRPLVGSQRKWQRSFDHAR